MSFHLSAENIRVEDGHILIASLANTDGDWNESQLDLDYYIGNNEGSFEWGAQNFSHSANDISFSLEGEDNVPVLRASLSDSDGNGNDRDLNLSERIGNDNGVLIFQAS